MFKRPLTLNAGGPPGGDQHAGPVAQCVVLRRRFRGGSRHLVLPLPPPRLVDLGDRLLGSTDSDAITAFGSPFAVEIDAYPTQPLRMDTLRVILSTDADRNLVATATNSTHVLLDALTLGLAPTPD
ncbi:MAG: hypothetical protein WCQ45_01210 [bacterium]